MRDDLQSQLSELRELVEAQAAEIGRLRSSIDSGARPAASIAPDPFSGGTAGTAGTAGTTGTAGGGPAPGAPPSDGISRRAFTRLGGLAALGAAASAGALLGAANPAAADQGSAVLLGEDNTGATARTSIVSSTLGLRAQLADPDVSFGQGAGQEAGVVGIGPWGVVGSSVTADSFGVVGTDFPVNLSPPTGLAGGVLGTITNPDNASAATSGITVGTGYAVYGYIDNADNAQAAVSGQSVGTGPGVEGVTNIDEQVGVAGVDTSTDGGTGVSGISEAGWGVHGIAGDSSGLTPSAPVGAFGEAISGIGVYGGSGSGAGVMGVTGDTGGVGVQASNQAAGPSLMLLPSSSATLPSSSSPGQFMVLSDGTLNYCYATDEWVPLNATVQITPVRVINTTTGEGGITGPLVPGAAVHTSSAIAGTNGIPAGATGIVGNFAISGVGGALLNGLGVATIFPAGSSTPATANINAGAGCFAISNAVSVAFGTGADAGKLSIVWGGGGQVPSVEAFLDVTGYIL